MVTCLYFLSLCFQAVFLDLYEGLEDIIWVVLCEVHGLDLLWSLECGRRASIWWRPPMWCVTSVTISVWVSVVRCASLWMSVIWPGVTSLWITLAVTSVSVTAGMWSWPVKPVFVPVIMVRCGSRMVSCARMMFLCHIGYLMKVFYLDSLLRHDRIHHNRNILYRDNGMPCALILDTENICHLHLTWYLLWMRAGVWWLTAVLLGASLLPWWHLPCFGVPSCKLELPKHVHS